MFLNRFFLCHGRVDQGAGRACELLQRLTCYDSKREKDARSWDLLGSDNLGLNNTGTTVYQNVEAEKRRTWGRGAETNGSLSATWTLRC